MQDKQSLDDDFFPLSRFFPVSLTRLTGGAVCVALALFFMGTVIVGAFAQFGVNTAALMSPWLPSIATPGDLMKNLVYLTVYGLMFLGLTVAQVCALVKLTDILAGTMLTALSQGRALQAVCALTLLACVAGCATVVPSPRPEHQELMVTQTLDGGYVRGQQTALRLGWAIVRNHDAGWAFVMQRPSGEEISFRIERMALGCLITIQGPPGADVRDFVMAYQAAR